MGWRRRFPLARDADCGAEQIQGADAALFQRGLMRLQPGDGGILVHKAVFSMKRAEFGNLVRTLHGAHFGIGVEDSRFRGNDGWGWAGRLTAN